MRTTDWLLATGGVTLGLAAMAVDHLLGDDPGLEDPGAFLASAALIVVLAALLYGVVVRRARAPRRGTLIVAVLAVASLPLMWLGVPFVVGSAAVALGMRATGHVATAGVAVGVLVLLLVSGAYTYEAIDKLS